MSGAAFVSCNKITRNERVAHMPLKPIQCARGRGFITEINRKSININRLTLSATHRDGGVLRCRFYPRADRRGPNGKI